MTEGGAIKEKCWICVSFHILCTVDIRPQHLVGDPLVKPMRDASDSLVQLEEINALPNRDQKLGNFGSRK